VKDARHLAVALLLLALFFAQGWLFIRAHAQTYDEAVHLAAGYSYLATGDFRLDAEHPPLVKALQALPLFIGYRLPFDPDPRLWQDAQGFLIGRDFLYGSAVPADRMLTLARLVNLLLGGWLLVIVGWWAFRLWGRGAALAALALGSFDPNLIAHSSLVTTDVGVSAFMLSTVYLLWEYVQAPRWGLLAATGLSAGVALVSKFSALLLVPILFLIAVLLIGTDRSLVVPRGTTPHWPRHRLIHATSTVGIILAVSALVIPAVYLFEGWGPWLSGLRHLLAIAQAGRSSFYMGEYSYEGWWSYYLGAFLLKTPLGTLALVVLALGLQTARARLTWPAAVFLLSPVIVVFAVTTQSRVAVGLRYILPVYPFLFVLAGRVATVPWRRSRLAVGLAYASLLVAVLSSLRVSPHQLAYFNELVGGPDRGYRYLLDSNLDWGQDLKGVRAYMDREKLPIIYLSYFGTAPPAYYGIRHQFVPGSWPLEWPIQTETVPLDAPRKILAISANNLQDLFHSSHPLFEWLRAREPIATIGHSIFVYDLAHDCGGCLARLEETYRRAGLRVPEPADSRGQPALPRGTLGGA
jgi:4-amino-4-deoxy-L-arabinose transferase-like glycosyltransferase